MPAFYVPQRSEVVEAFTESCVLWHQQTTNTIVYRKGMFISD
jgi:hypothetical protein